MKQMKALKYSAGIVSKGFWFQEFKQYIQMLEEGRTDEIIKTIQADANVLIAPSKEYGMRMINEASRRVRALPKEIVALFNQVSLSDQKLINMLGIMMTDRLFFEYMYEVHREELMVGRGVFGDSSIRIFFKNKEDQSEKVAGFTQQTKNRLRGAYKTYLREANLIVEEKGVWVYRRPIIDIRLEEEIKKPELYPYFKALIGV